MKTRAVRDGDAWVLNGQKSLDHQRRRLEVLHGDGHDRPGTRAAGHLRVRRARTTTRASRSGRRSASSGSTVRPTREIYFENVRIPADRMIGAEGTGFATAMQTLDITRITIGAQALGIAQGALDAAVAYAKERKQFGKAIAEFQGLQFMLADMAMKVEAARRWSTRRRPRASADDRTSPSSAPPPSASPPTSRWRSPPTPCRSSAGRLRARLTRSSG